MWRNTGRPVKVLILDARACFPLLAFVVYWSWITFYVAMVGLAFFIVISWFGLTPPTALRTMRRWFVGPLRPAVPSWKRRRLA